MGRGRGQSADRDGAEAGWPAPAPHLAEIDFGEGRKLAHFPSSLEDAPMPAIGASTGQII